jgi:phytoene dehydrogenase-like protein
LASGCGGTGWAWRWTAPGQRTLTLSTHVPLRQLAAQSREEQARYVARIQERMREGLTRRVPEWVKDVRHELTASPRTFERFTRREAGAVGGVPRRAGLHHYRGVGPRPVMQGLWLVGDSVFPGQSTLATALGGGGPPHASPPAAESLSLCRWVNLASHGILLGLVSLFWR